MNECSTQSNKKDETRILYLPIEILNREFMINCLMAQAAVESGKFTSVKIIELNNFLSLAKLRLLQKGTILLKSAPDYINKTIKTLANDGHEIWVQDQEELVRFEAEDKSTDGIHTINHPYLSGIITEKTEKYNNKVVDVYFGHLPRIKLTRHYANEFYANEISEIRNKYPDGFTLLVSSNGHAFSGFDDLENPDQWGHNLDNFQDEVSAVYRQWSKTQKRIIADYYKLCVEHEQMDSPIVFRTHPSENITFFRYLLHGFEHVKLETGHSIIPWLLCCNKMICSTSTVAYEAKHLGVNGLILLPENATPAELATIECNTLFPVISDYKQAMEYKAQKTQDAGEDSQDDPLAHCRVIINHLSSQTTVKTQYKNLLFKFVSVILWLRHKSSRYYLQKFPGFAGEHKQTILANSKGLKIEDLKTNYLIISKN